MHDFQTLLEEARQTIESAGDLPALQQIQAIYLGKKGRLTEYLKQLGGISPEERPLIGQKVNQAKEQIQAWIESQSQHLKALAWQAKLQEEHLDVTLPGRGQSLGSLHPITLTRQRIEQCFSSLGFEVAEGPEIEDDYHNFTALNIPPHHPARAGFDTFYVGQGRGLLRTHTSPVQVRVMESTKPPIRVIAPGRVYRCDFDATHTPMFHQIEGLVIDEVMTFAHLKGLLQEFLRRFFDQEMVEIRLRPSYFPFTEPSAEVDVRWGDNQWLEVLGCGMVHPTVLENCGIDSERYTGFAFGAGIDRLAMLFYGITDLRLFFENDIRFLSQF